jgi:hypothetical protein
MLNIMKPNSTPQQIENVIKQVKEAGLAALGRPMISLPKPSKCWTASKP